MADQAISLQDQADFSFAICDRDNAFRRYLLVPATERRIDELCPRLVALARASHTQPEVQIVIEKLEKAHPPTACLSSPCRCCLLQAFLYKRLGDCVLASQYAYTALNALQPKSKGETVFDGFQDESDGIAQDYNNPLLLDQLSSLRMSSQSCAIDLIGIHLLVSVSGYVLQDTIEEEVLESIITKQRWFVDLEFDRRPSECLRASVEWCRDQFDVRFETLPPVEFNGCPGEPDPESILYARIQLFVFLWDKWKFGQQMNNREKWSRSTWEAFGICPTELLYVLSSLFLGKSAQDDESLGCMSGTGPPIEAALLESAAILQWDARKLCAEFVEEFVYLNDADCSLSAGPELQGLYKFVWQPGRQYLRSKFEPMVVGSDQMY